MEFTSSLPLLTTALLLTACLVSLFLILQVAATYTHAYLSAPHEIHTFIDAIVFSIQENESYDRDVAKITRLEDKLRLGKLLREIQKSGDDLREDVDGMLEADGGTRLKMGARVMWASKRRKLEERVRRGDMLRMRFLVVFMGLVASTDTATTPPKDPEKLASGRIQHRPGLPHGLTEHILRKPPLRRTTMHVVGNNEHGNGNDLPLRRLTTQAMGHNEHVSTPQKLGWAGVVAELQKSPAMHRRHASIERSMASPSPD